MFSVTIMEGRLTADPEMRRLASGLTLVNATIACEDDIKHEGKKDTTFISCTFFGSTAENVAKFFRKGRGIIVQGRLKQQEYTDKATGAKKIGYCLTNCTFSFTLSSKKEEEERPQNAPKPEAPTGLESSQKEVDTAKGVIDVVDDDLPF